MRGIKSLTFKGGLDGKEKYHFSLSLLNYKNFTSNVTPYLHIGEQKRLNKINSKERGRSYSFGRVAAKKAVETYLCKKTIDCDFQIENDCFGKPFISGCLTPPLYISISHSNRYAVAICSSKNIPITIDIQNIEKISSTYCQNVISNSELKLASDLEINLRDTLIWTIKEASAKFLGIGFTMSLDLLVVTNIEQVNKTTWISKLRGFPFQFVSKKIGNTLITLCFPNFVVEVLNRYLMKKCLSNGV